MFACFWDCLLPSAALPKPRGGPQTCPWRGFSGNLCFSPQRLTRLQGGKQHLGDGWGLGAGHVEHARVSVRVSVHARVSVRVRACSTGHGLLGYSF